MSEIKGQDVSAIIERHFNGGSPVPTPDERAAEKDFILKYCPQLFQAATWMSATGIIMIIGGAFQLLNGGLGLLIAILPIALGALLLSASAQILKARRGAGAELSKGFAKLKIFFLLAAILPSAGMILLIAVVILAMGSAR